MRTTRGQIDALFVQVHRLASSRGVDTSLWRLSYAPGYGGYQIEGDGWYLGEGFMDANRMPAGEFYKALRMLRDLLEKIPPPE